MELSQPCSLSWIFTPASGASSTEAPQRGQVAIGLLRCVCDTAERRYGLARAELLDAAMLAAERRAEPNALIAVEVLITALRLLSARTRDAGLGLVLAEEFDLRRQGFWGYALRASHTLRERLTRQVRYQSLRSPLLLSFWEAGGDAAFRVDPLLLPPDVAQLLVEFSVALEVRLLRSDLPERGSGLELWLTAKQRPHHAQLRAQLGAGLVFRAPENRLQFPAAWLDIVGDGDPHLSTLAITELERRLEAQSERLRRSGLVTRVKEQLRMRLASDPSLTSIAGDLGLEARTLQRQLARHGTSFQILLDEARRARASEYLRDSHEPIERIALHLGYRDASNFRRAFRRWTGVAPHTFRRGAK